ncbi:MAG: 50S ribosomal protein L29 [Patescibacteria group bacterium]
MKKTDLQNLRGKNDIDLLNDMKTDKDYLWQLKMDLAAGKVKNVREIRKVRQRIAISKTLIKEKSGTN